MPVRGGSSTSEQVLASCVAAVGRAVGGRNWIHREVRSGLRLVVLKLEWVPASPGELRMPGCTPSSWFRRSRASSPPSSWVMCTLLGGGPHSEAHWGWPLTASGSLGRTAGVHPSLGANQRSRGLASLLLPISHPSSVISWALGSPSLRTGAKNVGLITRPYFFFFFPQQPLGPLGVKGC